MNPFEEITGGLILPGISDFFCTGFFDCLIYYAGIFFQALFLLVVIGGIIAILYGSFNFITETSQESTKKAIGFIKRGIIGVIIGALSFLIVKALLNTLS